MANTGTIVNAKDGHSLAWSIREEDLDELEALKSDLIDKGAQARADGRLFVSSQYTKLVAMIAPEVKRIRDRFDRESLAAIRKEEADLKLQARTAKQAQQDRDA